MALQDTDPTPSFGGFGLRWALARRNDLRKEKIAQGVLLHSDIQGRLQAFTSREQRAFHAIASRLSGLPEVEPEDVNNLMFDIMDSYDDRSVREMIEHIADESEPTQERMWALVAEFGLIDARRTATKVQARMQVIRKLEELVEGGAPEVPDIHNHLRDNPWLLDPRWDLYDDEVNLTKMLQEKYGFAPVGQGNRADYLFAIGTTNPTSADETIVVEVKRGRNADGSAKNAGPTEITKFAGYVEDADAYYAMADSPSARPTVRGVMVASGFTQQADSQRRALQSVRGGRYQFKSWRSVLRDTKRLHFGWLELSSRRGKPSS